MARMDASRLAALQARIEDAERKLSTLADLYLDNRISREDYFAEFNAKLRSGAGPAGGSEARDADAGRAGRDDRPDDAGGPEAQPTPHLHAD